MIKKCKGLLAGLKEQLKLAREIQKECGTHNMDVNHIEFAIQAVSLRIDYLEKIAGQPKAEKPKAEDTKVETPNPVTENQPPQPQE